MNIVKYQHADILVEIDKFVGFLGLAGHGKLGDELRCANVKHHAIRESLTDTQTDGLCQVGLAEPRTSVDEKWVECRATPPLGAERLADLVGDLVAGANYKILKAILGA